MASDETFNSDESVGGRGNGVKHDIELPDRHGEIRIALRANESTGETSEPDESARELRVSRYDHAAAHCGRWGDGQWR